MFVSALTYTRILAIQSARNDIESMRSDVQAMNVSSQLAEVQATMQTLGVAVAVLSVLIVTTLAALVVRTRGGQHGTNLETAPLAAHDGNAV